MSYVVFARRYRPTTFDEVVGQESVATTLCNSIINDRVGHAYVFCGPRGVGKTSMARIFARALNCVKGPTPTPCGECEPCQSIAAGTDVDVIEIDGASNRGVEDARRLRQSVAIAPSRSATKIYIIDEVHMLTAESFNTLLKTLEEPPPHVKFILATTEPHRILDTILSRCQRFDFRRISLDDIVRRLEQICQKEGVQAEPEVLRRIARASRGGMRDSQSVLDQLISFTEGKVTVTHLERVLGRLDEDAFLIALDRVLAGDPMAGLQAVADVYERGLDPEGLLEQMIDALRARLIVATCSPQVAATILDESPDYLERLSHLGASGGADLGGERITGMLSILLETGQRMRRPGESQPRLLLEMAFFLLASSARMLPAGEILARLEAITKSSEGGRGAGDARGTAAPRVRASESRGSAAVGGAAGGAVVAAAAAAAAAPARSATTDLASGSRSGARAASTPPPPPPPPPPPDEIDGGASSRTQPRARGRRSAANDNARGADSEDAPAGTSGALAQIGAAWGKFAATVECVDHDLGALLVDIEPTVLDDGTLIVVVPPRFEFHARRLADGKASERITALAEATFEGVQRVEIRSPAVGAPPKPVRPRLGRRPQRDVELDPWVAPVLGKFSGRILNVEEE